MKYKHMQNQVTLLTTECQRLKENSYDRLMEQNAVLAKKERDMREQLRKKDEEIGVLVRELDRKKGLKSE